MAQLNKSLSYDAAIMPTDQEAAQSHSAAARRCFGISNFAVFVVSNSLRLRGQTGSLSRLVLMVFLMSTAAR
jgi:hypothetical protein